MNWLSQLFKKLAWQTNASVKQVALPLKVDADAELESTRLNDQGNTFFEKSNWSEAIVFYTKAIQVNPKNHKAIYNLGCSYWYLGQLNNAERYLKEALDIHSEHFDAYWMLADINEKLQDFDKSFHYINTLTKLRPDFIPAKHKLASLYAKNRNLAKLINYIESEKDVFLSNPNGYSMYLFYLLSEGKLSLESLLKRHKEFASIYEHPESFCQFPLTKFTSSKKLKIGYLSFDFIKHPVSLFMLPILENHDRSKVISYVYHTNDQHDMITKKVQNASDYYKNIHALNNQEIVNLILQDDIDILVDLNGHTTGNKLLVFAKKPAPVQISYLGYVYTTGLRSIDYRFSNVDADPEENNALYVEETYRFRNRLWWTYRIFGDLPEITPLPALKNNYITFISTNAMSKITDDCLRVWASILSKLPHSKLKVAAIPHGVHREQLISSLMLFGANKTQVEFVEFVPLDEFRSLTQTADIALDTFPYNGGTTTCEVLLCGLPVIAFKGQSFYSRMGYAILKDVGIDNLVASNEEEYINIAVSLASDIERLSSLRATMRERVNQSSLLDEIGFTRDLELAYQEMWHNVCALKHPSN